MTSKRTTDPDDDLLDVRRVAAILGRNAETVRRWVWSGRLAARRQGNRLMIRRADVDALAESEGRTAPSLAEWAESARAVRRTGGVRRARRSAADLVLEDRSGRA